MTILQRLEESYGISKIFKNSSSEQFFEWDLATFGLSAEKLLEAVLKTEKQIGLRGWRAKETESQTYKGFSLCYNKNLGEDPYASLGDFKLTQVFSVQNGHPNINELKDSYYDTYSFNQVHPAVKENFDFLTPKFKVPLIRSRVSYVYPLNESIKHYPFHRDEFVYHNLRVNIPLQTSKEYILEIDGEDEFSNNLRLKKHLEVGKLYIWNTRIPHRVTVTEMPLQTNHPRIHLVLGFCPWFDFENEEFKPNSNFGKHPFDLFAEGKIIKF